jgi:hypothetical protein
MMRAYSRRQELSTGKERGPIRYLLPWLRSKSRDKENSKCSKIKNTECSDG